MGKTFQKVLSFMLAIIMIVSMIPVPTAHAATVSLRNGTGGSLNRRVMVDYNNGYPRYIYAIGEHYVTRDGVEYDAYCITPNRAAVNNLVDGGPSVNTYAAKAMYWAKDPSLISQYGASNVHMAAQGITYVQHANYGINIGKGSEEDLYAAIPSTSWGNNVKGAWDAIESRIANMGGNIIIPSFSYYDTYRAQAHPIALDYNAATGMYTKTVTDSNNMLSHFDFNSLSVNGLTFTRSGNNLTISATRAFVTSHDFSTGYVPGSVTSDTGSSNFSMNYVRSFRSTNDDQNMAIYEGPAPSSSDPPTAYIALQVSEGALMITKSTDDGSNLDGFTFVVTGPSYPDGQAFTTNTQGIISLQGLTPGTYNIRESNVPARYITPDPQNVVVTGGQTATVDFTNVSKQMSVVVVKQDADAAAATAQGDAVLDGAQFSLYNSNGTWIDTRTVTGGAVTFSNLGQGSYYIEETQAPVGYNMSYDRIDFTISSDLLNSQQDQLNYGIADTVIRGGLSIQKYDADLNQPYPQGNGSFEGIEFDIINSSRNSVKVGDSWYAPNSVIDTLTTNSFGYASTSAFDLPYGTYTIREKTVPAESGYVNSGFSQTVTITEQGFVAEVHATNTINRGGVTVQKIDLETGLSEPQGNASLAGAQIAVFNRSENAVVVNGTTYGPNETVLTLVTDANGRASTDSQTLPYGTYELKEMVAPAGYELDLNWSQVFTISENNETYEFTSESSALQEQVLRGGLALQKADYETALSNPQGNGSFAGITFNISNASTNSVWVDGSLYAPGSIIKTLTTDASGYAATEPNELPYGTYQVTESDVPESTGYLNNGFSQTFDVVEPGMLANYQVTNTVKRGGVKVQKLDADTGLAESQGSGTLAGAKIDVINRSTNAVYVNGNMFAPGSVVMTLITDDNGYAASDNNVLPVGEYELCESEAPAGYGINTSWSPRFSITENGQIFDCTTEELALRDSAGRAGISIQKADADSNLTSAQGNGSFKDIVFSIKNGGSRAIIVGGVSYAPGDEVMTITTNANGLAETGGQDLPFGTYVITEKVVPSSTGYRLSSDWSATATINEAGAVVSYKVSNNIMTGGVKVQKLDAETGLPESQGGGTLAGATIQIINRSANDVYVGGNMYAPGAVVMTIVTDDSGFASTGSNVLPFGSYEMVETEAPAGYAVNPDWNPKFSITADGQVFDCTTDELALRDSASRAGISVHKSDADSNQRIAQGDSSFEGIVFSIANGNNSAIVIDGVSYAPGEEVMTITTDAGGYAETDRKALPFGTYIVTEKSVPASCGYRLNTTWSATVTLDETGKLYEVSPDASNTATKAGKLSIRKMDGELMISQAQGDATLEGSEIDVINMSAGDVVIDGSRYGLNDVILTIRTGEDGIAVVPSGKIPFGSYRMIEKTAPMGYLKNDSWAGTFQVRNEGEEIKLTSDTLALRETPIRGGISVQKYDADTSDVFPQGDGSFEGIEFEIVNASANSVLVSGTEYMPGDVVKTLTTNEYGFAQTGAFELPYGTYYVREKSVPDNSGYMLNSEWTSGNIEIRSNGKVYPVVNKAVNHVIRGGVNIQKLDAETLLNEPQGSASLAGAEFTITNASANSVVVDGVSYGVGEAVAVLKTDENGLIATGDSYLPYGSYDIVETKAPAGYKLNTDWHYHLDIRENGVVFDLTTGTASVKEQVIRGGVAVQKLDAETSREQALGEASLAGAEISIRNVSDHAVKVNDQVYAPGAIVAVIITNASGYATTAENALPYGKYELTETKAPIGYFLNESWVQTVTISEDGQMTVLDNSKALREQVYRCDIRFEKVHGDTMERMASIPFRVTSKTTGESHIIVTDVNGIFDSSLYGVDTNTNKNDAAVDAEGNVDESLLDSAHGVWFSGNREGRVPDGAYSAFPFDTYTFEELPVSGNAHTKLVSFEITLYRNIEMLDIGTIDDNGPAGIHTVLLDRDSQDHIAQAEKDAHLVDTIDYSGLVAGHNYVLEGKLVDADSGAVVTTETISFMAEAADGTLSMEFQFDASNLAGHTLVATQTLKENDEEVVVADNLNDLNETVYFPAIGTKARGLNGQNQIAASSDTTVIDTVSYKNLIPNVTYELKSTLVYASTGEVVRNNNGTPITATQTFKPSRSSGEIEVIFKFDASRLSERVLVAFEELTRNSTIIAEHKDLSDNEQTVFLPEISTTLVDENGSHIATAANPMVLTDTVTYEGLIPGETYTVVGTLMDKATERAVSTSSGAITAEKTFVPTEASGTVDISFEFNGYDIAGSAVVAFEELTVNGAVIAEHKDIEDEDQTVYMPSLKTTASGLNGSSELYANGQVVIRDTVEYRQLKPGRYLLRGQLVDKATGEVVQDSTGAEITGQKEIVVRAADGTETMSFTIKNAEILAGKTLVVFESLYDLEDKLIADHKDINDNDQTVTFPAISTNARTGDADTATAAGTITVVDTVTYENLVPGEAYTVNGTLMDKATGRAAKDVNGDNITATATFTAPDKNGSIELTFTFDASVIAGKTLVVFEELYNEYGVVAKHTDIEDEDQTVTVPTIKTVLHTADGSHIAFAEGELHLFDTVEFHNLVAGRTYTVNGTLMNRDTGMPITGADGTAVTVEGTITPETTDGTFVMEFIFDAKALENTTIVAFESVSCEGSIVAKHEDLTDEAQTVYIPEIRTVAADTDGNHEIAASGRVTVVDTVTYENLIPGKSYTLSGRLMDKETGEVAKDAGGNEIIAEAEFTPRTANGSTTISFQFDASGMEGKSLVAFETLTQLGVKVAVHEDLEDQDQTVSFPKIRTFAASVSGAKELLAGSEMEIIDRITYSNLIQGKTYTFRGTLKDATTGLTAKNADGDPITAENVQQIGSSDGTVEVSFKFNGTNLEGKSLVVFEEVRDSSGRTVAKHEQLDDKDQTVTVPKIRTMLFSTDNTQVVNAVENTTVTDYIVYENLVIGTEYTVTGKLMNKETGAVAVDADGNEVVTHAKFTAENNNGTVAIPFTFNASNMASVTLVAFEEISNSTEVIAKHEDLTDEEQTVYVPGIRTTATDRNGNKELLAYGNINIVDIVNYENLQLGKTYTLQGVLVDQATGEPVLDASGSEIRSTSRFTVRVDGTGSATMTFAIRDASTLAGKTVVVFEELYLNDSLIASHKDLEDQEQTVFFPWIGTTAHGENGEKEFLAGENMKLVDTVEYRNLIPGEYYLLTGSVMNQTTGRPVKDPAGNDLVATKTFSPVSANGSVDMEFEVDASSYGNMTLVVYEELQDGNGNVIARHRDQNDAAQTVTVPEIATTLTDENSSHVTLAKEDMELTDTVIYKNLIPGKTYTVAGRLVNKADGSNVLDANGNEIKSDATFTPTEANGSVQITFHFNGSNLAGTSMVAFESMSNEYGVIAIHEDLTDKDQTVVTPKIGTVAADQYGNKEFNANSNLVIIDTVSYENLLVGEQYTVRGTLYDKSTGEPALDASGSTITAETTFVARTADGTIQMRFTLDASNMAGKSLVVFETMLHNDVVIASHEDIKDQAQTVTFPRIQTLAHNENGGHEFPAEGRVTVIDTVSYENLVPGTTYIITGTLMDKDTGKAVKDSNNDPITATVTFTPDAPNGTVDVRYEFDADKLGGKSLVSYERLMNASYLVATHEDINDEKQTVTLPEIRTTLKSEDDIHMALAEGTITLTDTVIYKNLTIGKEYTFKGTLMDKATGLPVIGSNGQEITSEVKHTPITSTDSVALSFTFNAADLKGTTIVAFEQVSDEYGVVAKHEDLTDEDQIVRIPELHTFAADANGSKSLIANGRIEILDTVEYSDLKIGDVYTVKGILMNKATGEAYVDGTGNQITAEKTFTATASEGSIVLRFVVENASNVGGGSLVAFEDLYYENVLVGKHEDLNDEDQTVSFPEIRTSAHDRNNDKEFLAADNMEIIDTVTYSNLTPGESYTVRGELRNKATGKLAKDANGDSITAETSFTPVESSGTVDLTFEFDGSNLKNTTLVAFEDLYSTASLIARHADLEDQDQTVTIPEIRTTLQDKEESHVSMALKELVLTDTVLFHNLIPGREYTVEGVLYNKETGEPVMAPTYSGYDTVKASTTFTPDAPEGSVDVTFTFDASELAGSTVVAFERLNNEYGVVAIHEDLTDENQTGYIPVISTSAADKNGEQEFNANGQIELIDTVSYAHLPVGEQYTLFGVLMDKETGEPALDEYGSTITGSTIFTTTASEDTAIVKFTFDAAGMRGKTLVVFETLYRGDTIIAKHENINDQDQTITFPAIETEAYDQYGSKELLADGTVTIVDTVYYVNLVPGKTYTLSGTLMDKAIGRAARDANGDTIVSSTSFSPAQSNGSTQVLFTFDISEMAGKSLVAFESISNGFYTVATHEDIEDEDQTVTIPKIGTELLTQDNTHVAFADNELVLTDYVTYENLIVGQEYTFTGTLVDKETGNVVYDASGNAVTTTVKHTPENANDTIAIEFTFDASLLENTTVVAFESASNEYGVIAKHEDLEDEDQSVRIPGIRTLATDKNGEKEFYANGKAQIVDTVSYSGLRAGLTYTVRGVLMDKPTGEPAVDATGGYITAEKVFRARDAEGEITMVFNISDASAFEGKTLVVFEGMYLNGQMIAHHEDIEDADQTVTFPKIRTTLASELGSHEMLAGERFTVIDTVRYENLVPGTQYTVIGTLKDKATGKTIRDLDGYEVTAEATFVAFEANGAIDVTFEFDASRLENKTLVAFEQLKDINERLIAKHEDIEDEDQTVTIPKIRTQLFTEDGTQTVYAGNEVRLTDYISFENLVEGHEYTITGQLMDKETGYPAIDAAGNEIVSAGKFTASSSNGVAQIEFVFDASEMSGKTLVAFEKISDEKDVIAVHEDIEDTEQTVYIPKIGTSAADKDGNKEFLAKGTLQLIDTVSYESLKVGENYTLTGILFDSETSEPALDAFGNNIVAYKDFTARTVNGTVQVLFTIDASSMEGKTLIVVEKLTQNGNTIAQHADLDDEAQTIRFPKIRTTAHDVLGSHEFLAEGINTVIDTVAYENLIPGETYMLTGVLMDKATGRPVTDDQGDEVKATTLFTPMEPNGTIDVVFELDFSKLANSSLVAFEQLYANSRVVGQHQDIEDEDQTISVPEIRTTLLSEAETHIVPADSSITLTDTVIYKNLIPGRAYTFEGTLMDKETGYPVVDENGKTITAKVEHIPEYAEGSANLTFVFDGSRFAGKEIVAFEQVSNGYGVIAKHEDLEDKNQTVNIPEIRTFATDAGGMKEIFANGTLEIRDTVTYEALLAGEIYTVTGVLVDKATGEPWTDEFGNYVTASKSFVAKASYGEVTLSFEIMNASQLKGKTLVAYEGIYFNSVLIASHEDLNDAGQTVTFPAISTTAHNSDGDHEFLASNDVTVIDTVTYSNLIPGRIYMLQGELRNKETGKVAKDSYGDEIRAVYTFIPDTANGTTDIIFTFNGSNMEGKTLVAFEDLYNDERVVARHADIEDSEQTVTFPKIATTLLDDLDNHITRSSEEIRLTDTIVFNNLIPGREYTVTGTLMNKATGEPVQVKNEDGTETTVTSSGRFTPDTADGTIEIEFVFSAAELEGITVVAFERLSNEFTVIATHEDLTDEDQIVYVPEIRTTATDPNGYKDLFAEENGRISDVIEFTNLKAGEVYTARGTLYIKETGEALTDSFGSAVTAEKQFKAPESNGTVVVDFHFDASMLAGKSVVVYEELIYNDAMIAEHKDLEDEGQTIYIPQIKTEAIDRYEQHVTITGYQTYIKDQVSYTNLIPGESYELLGTLVLRSNGKTQRDEDADIIQQTVFFTPEEPNGTVDVEFTADTTEFVDDCLVVFESLMHDGRVVAEHKDISDELQTIHFPSMKTFAKLQDGSKTAMVPAGTETVRIIDTITYTNLVPGEKYKVSGSLMNASDGLVIRNSNSGQPYIAEAEFIPEEANGTVDVVFEPYFIDVKGLKVVVFESLMLGRSTIATHNDLDDADQAVTIPYLQRVRKYDASSYEGLAGAVFEIKDNGLADQPGEYVELLPTVRVTSDENGYIYFTALPGHEYSLKEITAPDTYFIDTEEHFVVVNDRGELSGDIEIQNIKGGTIVLSKTDVITGNPIPGCEISIYRKYMVTREIKDADGKVTGTKQEMVDELVFSQVTDKDGRIYFYTDIPGDYYFRETKTVDGYYLNEDVYQFTVDEDMIMKGDANITNVPFGTVVLTKTDPSGKPLQGAEFSIYDEYNQFLGKGVTDKKGRVYFISPGPGRYYFVETKAPTGYELNTDRHYFTIAADYTIGGAIVLVDGRNTGPSTGDLNNVGLWAAVFGVSFITTAAVYLFMNRRKKEESEPRS